MAPRNESTCTDDEELVVSVTRISGVFNKRFGQTPLFKIVDNSHDGIVELQCAECRVRGAITKGEIMCLKNTNH